MRNMIIFTALAGVVLDAPAEPTVGETIVLGPFTGHYAPLHPDNIALNRIAYYGTDLGFTYEHKGLLHFLFGDTTATEAGERIEQSTGAKFDDAFGTIDLADWPDPDRITPINIPLIKLGQNPSTTETSAINPGHALESFKTPVGGFSNGDREFGVFYTHKPKGCTVDEECVGGHTCDAGLGYVGEPYTSDIGLTFACTHDRPGCVADTMVDSDGKTLAGSGFCVDRTSTIWADTGIGRSGSVAIKHLVGIRSTTDPRIYSDTKDWWTSKFANPAIRTVEDFVPARGTGHSNHDYRRASASGANQRVFIWGRPGFIGVATRGRPLGLYFAYTDMPTGSGFSWQLQYFTGLDEQGNPRFSANESDAAPLDLDSTRAGIQFEELHDVIDQMSVVWIEHLKKWVMFYGGGMINLPTDALPHCGVLELFTGSECRDVVIGNGAIRMRTADDPWGPWTPPQDVIIGGDPNIDPIEGQYRPGGVLHHPKCTEANCAPRTDAPDLQEGEYGFFYGANIIEQWIKPAGAGVNVIWNASTWDPYRVILLRTRIER
jgi:hypothetical protein